MYQLAIVLLTGILLIDDVIGAESNRCAHNVSSTIDWRSLDQFAWFFDGFNPLLGPSGDAGRWPVFAFDVQHSANLTGDCRRMGKIRNRYGTVRSIVLPKFVQKLENYASPSAAESRLVTQKSDWTTYLDWRQRRSGLGQRITNRTALSELTLSVEWPSSSWSFATELRTLLQHGRHFRVSLPVVSGLMNLSAESVDDLHPIFRTYLQNALDGRRLLSPYNRRFSSSEDDSQQEDTKWLNWRAIFGELYGTHYAKSIKFGYTYDVLVRRKSCRERRPAELSELARCYFAETKLNLSLASSGSKDLFDLGRLDVCPELRPAIADLIASASLPDGEAARLEHLSVSAYLKSAANRTDRFWQPGIVQAELSPLCDLVPLIRPNDLDAKVECETQLMRYLRLIEPIDNRRSTDICDINRQKILYNGQAFCLSKELSDDSCSASGIVRSTSITLISLLFSLIFDQIRR